MERDPEDKDSEKENIRGALNLNGYPDWAVDRVKSKKLTTELTLDWETDQLDTLAETTEEKVSGTDTATKKYPVVMLNVQGVLQRSGR